MKKMGMGDQRKAKRGAKRGAADDEPDQDGESERANRSESVGGVSPVH